MERLIEHAAHDFFVRCGEMATELYLGKKEQLKGILLGGPGATKEYFYKEGYLHYELQQKVVQPLFDVGYTDEYGLRELVEKATQTLHGLELTEEKRTIQRLLAEIRKAEGGLAAYGEKQVDLALEAGAVELLLVSEGTRKKRVSLRCGQCQKESTRSVPDDQADGLVAGPCPYCGAPALQRLSEADYVDDLYERAGRSGAKVRLISSESEEGELLGKAFGGVAAILRYPMGDRLRIPAGPA